MQTHAQTFGRTSAMPAPTWHFLNMNDTVLEIPEGLATTSNARVSGSWKTPDVPAAFDDALAAAQAKWEATHPAPTPEELAEREAYRISEADATYGGTAQSTYQADADALEEARSLALAFKHGTSEEIASFLREAAGDCIVVEADPGQTTTTQVVVGAIPNALNATAIDVIARRGSTVSLSILVDSPQWAPGTQGFTGTTVRVFADADARVNVVRTQTLDDGLTDIDDMGLFADDRARIEIRQVILGGSSTFTGLAGDLRGDSARIDVETRYLGHGSQSHDLNFVLRHHGTRTQCNLNANGVLAGKSSKTLRGTIDLIRGCKGAEGTENETVLLVDEGVRNKTVPVILCNEDDVAGNHGATIGHVGDEQLFYLATRGLSQEAAEAMFVSAALEQAAIEAPDEISRLGVMRLGEHIVPGFADLFSEEV